jgi:hypothetical protein
VLKSLTVVLAAAVAAGAGLFDAHPGASDVTVHEWGTFTSIAGEDGGAIPWLPLDGPSDLPCFVERSYPVSPKGALFARVRMETPVLYFYSPGETTLDVRVGFRQGFITEHFPAGALKPETVAPSKLIEPGFASEISWRGVRILPGAAPAFRTEEDDSHYYAARATDAASIAVSNETERFLFYRGVGDFALPVTAKVTTGDAIVVNTIGSGEVPAMMRFENRGGRIGYAVQDAPSREVTFPRPELNQDLDATKAALGTMLEAQGLYPPEAHAMIETWRDSWFTEGSRLFYVVPRQTVDTILPLRISPRPDRIARVFVGRLELATEATLTEIRTAAAGGDNRALQKYERFLMPFGERVLARTADSLEASQLRSRLENFTPAFGKAPSCQ